jgi:hypothetical protein
MIPSAVPGVSFQTETGQISGEIKNLERAFHDITGNVVDATYR